MPAGSEAFAVTVVISLKAKDDTGEVSVTESGICVGGWLTVRVTVEEFAATPFVLVSTPYMATLGLP